MSSNAYSTCLYADRVLRRWVLASGILLSVIGALLIVTLPVATAIRLLLLITWLAWHGRETRMLLLAYGCYRGIELNEHGELALLDRHGQRHAGRLLPGSLVLRRIAWIRVRDARGRVFAEPLRGRCGETRAWRRLQVIWRHVGAVA